MQRQIEPQPAAPRARPGPASRYWFQRNRRWLGDMGTIALLLLVLFPFAWLVQMSFRPNKDILGYELLFEPTLAHYKALWTGAFPASFVNSTITSVSSTVLALVIGVPAAYALSRGGFRSSRRIALWILATRMAPPIAFTIPFFLAYRYLGLSDTLIGLIIVYLTFNLALVIWMMQPFFDGVPRELEEAAWIDGCGVWEAFWRVTLPLVGAGARCDGSDLLHPVVERLLLRPGADAHERLDRAGRDRQLHPVHGLGVGAHRRGRDACHAACRHLLDSRAQLPRARPRRRRRQGMTSGVVRISEQA